MPGEGLRLVGHKGADLIAPGNTVESFHAAAAAGVHMIEMDVLWLPDSHLPLEQRHPLVYPLCIGCTALQSVASALPLGPLSALAKALPFGAVGFGWVLPAAVGILAGMLLRPTPHEP